MGELSFHPELFELRNDVISWLEDGGFDHYGIEVWGAKDRRIASGILELLRSRLPEWPVSYTWPVDWPSREPGWVVVIQRDAELQSPGSFS